VFLLIVERKKQDHLAAASPKSDKTSDQAAAIKAAFFRFLRLASRPINPKPPPKSGAAAGKGLSAIMILFSNLIKSSSTVRLFLAAIRRMVTFQAERAAVKQPAALASPLAPETVLAIRRQPDD
jgi:hypothetical protein